MTRDISRHESATEDGERPGLREAALAVIAHAEPDENFEGEYIGYLVPAERIAALTAAAATPTPDDRDREVERIIDVDRLALAIREHDHVGKSPEDRIACDRGHTDRCADRITAAYYDAGLRASGRLLVGGE